MKLSPKQLNSDGLPEPINLFRNSVSLAGGQIHILAEVQRHNSIDQSSNRSPRSVRHSVNNAIDPTAPSPLKSLLTEQEGVSNLRRPLVSIYSTASLFENNQLSPDYDVAKDPLLTTSQITLIPSSSSSSSSHAATATSPESASPDPASATISPVPSTSIPTTISFDGSSASLSGALAMATSSALLSPVLSPQLSPRTAPTEALSSSLPSHPSSALELHQLLAHATSKLKSSMDSFGSTEAVLGALQQEEQMSSSVGSVLSRPASDKPLQLPRVLANRPKAYHRQLTDAVPAAVPGSSGSQRGALLDRSGAVASPLSASSVNLSATASASSSLPPSQSPSAPSSPSVSAQSSIRSEPESDAEWRAEMRAGWQQEIEKMPPGERAQWYQQQLQLEQQQKEQQQPLSPVSKSPSATTRKQVKRQNDDIRDALESHRSQLKPLLGRGEAKLRELRDKEAQLRAAVREQLDKLQSWHRLSLARVYRRLATLQLLHIFISRAILQRKIQLVQARIDDINKLIALTKTSLTVVSLPLDIYDDANAIFGKKEITQMVRVAQRVDKKIVTVKATYLRQRTELASEDRIGRIRQLISAAQVSSVAGYHEWNTTEQSSFEELFLDQRHKEGKGIMRLRSTLANPKEPIVPVDIVDFLEQFSDQFDREHNFGAESLHKLRLYVARAVYPRVHPFTWQMVASDTHAALDAKFRERQQLLRPCIRQKLEIDAKFFVEEQPFRDAIEALNEIPFHLVPTDMIKALHSSMQLILTRACSINKKDIAADELLPLFIYVVCFSDIWLLHQHLAFMDSFASEYEKMTELGYCLTTFQAAVQHLMNVPL